MGVKSQPEPGHPVSGNTNPRAGGNQPETGGKNAGKKHRKSAGRMSSRILYKVLLLSFCTLLAGLLVTSLLLYRHFSNVQESRLKDDLLFASSATEELGVDYLKGLKSTQYRLTLIAADGTVLYDNRADAANMENHLNREEIHAALLAGSGSSQRYSTTLTQRTLYGAQRLRNGSVLRVALSQKSVWMLIFDLLRPLALIALLALMISALIGHRLAQSIVRPLNAIDLENPMENDVYDELSPLLHRIYTQQREIRQRIRTLREKQDEFEQITNNMSEALVLLDREGRVLSINPAARKLLRAEHEVIGREFVSLSRNPELRQAIQRAEKRGHDEIRLQLQGGIYQVDMSSIHSTALPAASAVNGDGSNAIKSTQPIQGLVILAYDISERVRAEQTRREFTANVSHELRTPLQGILGSSELLDSGLVKPEDQSRFIGHIRREAEKLLQMIEDMIELSRLDEGIDMPSETLELRPLAEEIMVSLKERADTREVRLELDAEDVKMHGVRQLIKASLYNLCDNAIKYNHPGGQVKVKIRREAEQIQISVEDNGMGIPYEDQSKVFERFYRVNKSHSSEIPGTGLGLSIVKRAILYHNGRIRLDSEPGKGTRITLIFDEAD